jgi:hypothetical protein
MNIVPHISKTSRYTIGARIENNFLDLLELSYVAYFTAKDRKEEKIIKIEKCISTLDLLKLLVSVAWEGKIISNRQFEDVSLKLDEVGKMLGGWKGKLENLENKNRTFE